MGGRVPADEDPARRPVDEAGGGQAEGFERAEEDIRENAEHGQLGPRDPRREAFAGEEASDIAASAYGEGDLLVAALAGEQIRRVRLEDGEATVDEPMFEGPSDASARWWRARTVPSTRSRATATAAARHARVTPDSPDRATAY